MSTAHSTLLELLRWRAAQQADQVAYTFLLNGEEEGPSLTYRELDRQSRAIGALLQNYGADKERILLLYPPGLECIPAFFGCLYAGAIAIPAYPPRQKGHLSRLSAIIENAQATLALTTEKMRSKIHAWFMQTYGTSNLRVVATDTIPENQETSWQKPDVTSQNLAFLQYTSGSTKVPKGVMVSHANLLHNLAEIHKSLRIQTC